MKKKILILIVILLGILVFLCTTQKINLMQNLKKIINKQDENTKQIKEVTKVDITDLESNINIEHEHIFKTAYDETNHWKECTICGKKENKLNHSLEDNGWTMGGINNCSENNVHIYGCQCGYNYNTNTGRAGHKYNAIQNSAVFMKYYQCSVCQKNDNLHSCYKRDGSRITCKNLGVCSICNYNYTTYVHAKNFNNRVGVFNGSATCELCNTSNLAFINYSRLEKVSELEYKYDSSKWIKDRRYCTYNWIWK